MEEGSVDNGKSGAGEGAGTMELSVKNIGGAYSDKLGEETRTVEVRDQQQQPGRCHPVSTRRK